MIANAVASAVTPSASASGGSSGAPSGSPLSTAKPLIASASVPKPARWAYGPVWPKPLTRASTSRGFTAESSSQPTPQRSSVPGRKFSSTTSERSARRRKMSAPAGFERSSVTSRLFRASALNQSPIPSLLGPCPRAGSTRCGCSILTTSAP